MSASSERLCVECARASIPSHDDIWTPGEYCLFGMLYVCSVACARKYATRESSYRRLPDGALVDPALDWEYTAAADDGDEGTLCVTTTPADVEAMRIARNSCREFMTRDTSEITPERQVAWFSALDRTEVKPFVFRIGGAPVGYGLVRLETLAPYYVSEGPPRLDGRWWLSGGLLPPWRGRGYGKRLFAQLAAVAGTPCWLDVRKDNLPGRRTYAALGFQETGSDDTVAVMRLG